MIGQPAELGGGTGRNLAERKEWSAEEDARIRESVAKHGYKWRLVAADVPGRSDDAVRNRWNRIRGDGEGGSDSERTGKGEQGGSSDKPRSHTRKELPSGEGSKPDRVTWSRFEDEMIIRSVQELGHKWGQIADRLSGRTEHAIRNRFARLQMSLNNRGKPIILSSGAGVPLGIALVPR